MSEENNNDTICLHSLLGLSVAAALVAAGIQYAGASDTSPAAAGASAPVVTAAEGERVDLKIVSDHRSRGAQKPNAQLVVYGDFASPFAATAGRVVDQVMAEFPNDEVHLLKTRPYSSTSGRLGKAGGIS